MHNFLAMARREQEDREVRFRSGRVREAQGEEREEEREESEGGGEVEGGRSKTRRYTKMLRWKRKRRWEERGDREELLVNYTDIPLTAAMREVWWKGKNFVPDRNHPNKVDVCAGVARLTRSMRWDCFFKQWEREEGEEEVGEEVQEERILKDGEVKTNLPRGWQPPRALRDFESAVSFNATSPSNLVTIRPNLSPIEAAAIKDLQQLSRERVVVIKPTDKTGGLAMLPFGGYNAAMKTILAERFEEEGLQKPTYPPSSQAKVKKDFQAIVKILKEGCEKGFYGEKDLAAAIPDRPRPGKLYGLPKDHKPC